MTIFLWIIFGGVAGWISSLLINDEVTEGSSKIVRNITVGILGAFLGGWISANLLGHGITGFNISSLILAIGGSVLLLAIFSGFNKAGSR